MNTYSLIKIVKDKLARELLNKSNEIQTIEWKNHIDVKGAIYLMHISFGIQ